MAIGNTFGATALASYGAFWISYAILLTPSFGIASAYTTTAEYNHAIGFFLMVKN
jgi:succinate-acetate transporter protein